MTRLRILSILFFIASSKFAVAGECTDELWNEMIPKLGVEPSSVLSEKWSAIERQCATDITFDYRNALIFIKSKEFSEAELIINAGFNKKLSDYRFLKLAQVELNIQKFALKKEAIFVEKASKKSLELIADYPNWFAGYEKLGTIRAIQGKYAGSLGLFIDAVKRGSTSLSHGFITVSNYQLDKYLEAVNNSEEAILKFPELLNDKNFMLSTVMSYIALGELVKAESSLIKLLDAKPSIRADKEFIHAIKVLQSKINEQTIET